MIIGLKNLTATIVPALTKPLFWLGKFLLQRPFIQLYYLIFRVKKYELGQQSKAELLKKKSLHLIAFFLVITAFILNLTDKKQASAAIGKTKRSVMAEIVKNEFSDYNQNSEELIEEIATKLNPQAINAEKYLGRRTAIIASKGISSNLEEEKDVLLARDNNMIAKPKQIGAINPNSSGDNANNIAERQGIITYTVKAGDTISTIARRFRLNVNTILWSNNLNAFSIIRAGDQLSILPSDGFIYLVKRGDTIGKIANTYDISAEKIIASNNLNGAGSISIGQQLIIPGNKRAATTNTTAKSSSPNSYSGLEVIKDIVSAKKPIASGNKMVWPTVGHRITQYFSWKHNGVDIGNKIGTPIYAADSGVVEISQGGYNGGYGNTILINHGGGKKTRYGHASKLLVKRGEEVEKGQLIALMGSTGRSTGSHLHFEVVINGARYNPLNYIK